MKEMVSVYEAIEPGTIVQLKDGVLGDVKIRKWELWGGEKGEILLYRREGLTLKARSEDIDWEGHNEPKIDDYKSP